MFNSRFTLIMFMALAGLGVRTRCSMGGPPTPAEYAATGFDWPNFLGPTFDGRSAETGLVTSWPAEGPPKVWERAVGESYSAVVTSRGRVMVFHRVKDEEVIEALDARTGDPLWRHGYPTTYEDRYGYNGGPRSSPTIDGDFVYTFGAEGVLTCVKLADGASVWQRKVNLDYGVEQGFFGAGVAPVIEGGLVLINVGGPAAGVAGFKTSTGETAWTSTTDGASYSTPVVITLRGERIALFLTKDGFLALEPATGRVRYKMPYRSKTYESVNAATPVVVGDQVFLSATYNVGAVLLRLDPNDQLTTVWRGVDAMQNHWATALHVDGVLYGLDGRHENGANFRCIDWATGRLRWMHDPGIGRSTWTAAQGHLYSIGERGDLICVRLDPDKYVETARARVLRYPCWSPPVLSHGLLYIRNENRLVCFDMRAK